MLPASRAGGEGVVLHTLFDLKPIRADFTLVLVDGHLLFPPGSSVLKKSASFVLSSLDPQRTPRVRLGPSLAAALLDGLSEQPARVTKKT